MSVSNAVAKNMIDFIKKHAENSDFDTKEVS